ncbi:MAG: TlpA disulfide reductase family protein [Pseudoflavonifractor sp.]
MKLSLITRSAAALLLALTLSACAPGIPSGAAPVSAPPDGAAGILSAFTSTDLDGNPVDQTIFSDHKLTMVNVWATYCKPCLSEMPDLAALNTAYADRGFQVVGLVSDLLNRDGSISETQVAVAQDVVSSTGADYLHLMPSTDLIDLLLSQVTAVPTTIFVDEGGNMVGQGYLGAYSKDDWSKIIESLMTEVGA